ncbi:hypothetical protein AV903_14875 [Erwinia tracheiphila]|uniref:Uncharacterized protein n=1 Tax=Erwinia tracheiphila TaxID=65700 RepID=A0A345CUA2_9GAMM|nr:hypothetical protein AV903_14875 [Erwinia tracheiphila]
MVSLSSKAQIGREFQMSKEIAVEILNQLGGNKFIAMTGAKNFVWLENGGLIFKLPSNFA